MKLDLHVHTTASPDGFQSPAAAVRACVRRGLDGLAITDHNTMAAVAEAKRHAPEGFLVISGAEYSTDHGHILALFITEDAMQAGLPKDERGRLRLEPLSRFVRAQGGLLVAAHPFQGRASLPGTLCAWVDGAEVLNGRESALRPENERRAAQWAAQNGKFCTAGSDAHTRFETGRAYTECPDAMDFKSALLAGACAPRGRPAYLPWLLIAKAWKKAKRRLFR